MYLDPLPFAPHVSVCVWQLGHKSLTLSRLLLSLSPSMWSNWRVSGLPFHNELWLHSEHTSPYSSLIYRLIVPTPPLPSTTRGFVTFFQRHSAWHLLLQYMLAWFRFFLFSVPQFWQVYVELSIRVFMVYILRALENWAMEPLFGALTRHRTAGLIITNDALCQLSYKSIKRMILVNLLCILKLMCHLPVRYLRTVSVL